MYTDKPLLLVFTGYDSEQMLHTGETLHSGESTRKLLKSASVHSSSLSLWMVIWYFLNTS